MYFKILLYIIFSFYSLEIIGQNKLSGAEFLNDIISRNESINGINQLRQNFVILEKEAKSVREHNQIKIAEDVLTARLYQRQLDTVNIKSTALFSEAVESAKKNKEQGLLCWAYTAFGYYYYNYNDYLKAFPYFFQAQQILKTFSLKNLPDGVRTLKLNGYFTGTAGDYTKGIEYLKSALTIADKKSTQYGELLNNIGMYYYHIKDKKSARLYNSKAAEAALAIGDSARYAECLGEFAKEYIDSGNLFAAINLYTKDIEISMRYSAARNATYARIQLAKLYFKTENFRQTEEQLNEARAYILQKNYLKSFEQEIAELQLKISVLNHDDAGELHYRREIDSLQDVLSVTDGDEAMIKVNWQIQKENYLLKEDAYKSRTQKDLLYKWMLSIIVILLLTAVFFIYKTDKRKLNYQYEKYRLKVLSYQYQKLESEKKLAEQDTTLISYKEYLSEKNEQIALLEQEINKINNSPSSYLEKENRLLEHLLDTHLMTEDNWLHFKKVLKKENPEFFESVVNTFPGISESNLRIVILQKLGLSNKEIAGIIGISVEGVKKAKQRLRRKYNSNFEIPE